ncbi:rpsU-divergently transcribed protein [Batrachochytrium salamandrivorans]|nr:rpsU-divergently transcribed protein [Batrachochytrium salamandrivorans]
MQATALGYDHPLSLIRVSPFDVRLLINDSVDTESPQARLLEASLPFVPEHGWTLQAISQGARSLGYTDVTHGLLPRGPIELVEHFIQSRTRMIAPTLAEQQIDLSQMGMTARVRTACIARLMMTAPYVHKWPQAIALLSQPQNLPNTTKDLGGLVDEIWFLAGDKSVDVRLELYMTTDKSKGFEQTFRFLDRRLKDVGTFGRSVSQVSNVVGFGVRSAMGVLQSKASVGFFTQGGI